MVAHQSLLHDVVGRTGSRRSPVLQRPGSGAEIRGGLDRAKPWARGFAQLFAYHIADGIYSQFGHLASSI